MKTQKVNDLPGSCLDLKVGSDISRAGDSMNGTINKTKTCGRRGGWRRNSEGKAANKENAQKQFIKKEGKRGCQLCLLLIPSRAPDSLLPMCGLSPLLLSGWNRACAPRS